MTTSVIVVAYNSRAYLADCLDAILCQLLPSDEVIVVDNGSSDGTAGMLRARYPHVRLVESENVGYAGGNNRGASIAQGEYLLFLNPDTRLVAGAHTALVSPLQSADNVGLTTACVVHMQHPELINACGNTVHYTGLTYCRGAGCRRTEYTEAVQVNAVSGAAFAIRRTVFEALGRFDETFFMYVEDTDLSWRAQLAGYDCLYVPSAVVEHDYRPSYTPQKAFYLDRNRHLMLLKNLSAATYMRLLPGLLLSEVLTWGFLLINGPRFWRVKPRVYCWLWRERAAIRAAHQRTQRLRRRADRVIVARITHRLAFHQLAGTFLSRVAEAVFHPAFLLARQLLPRGRV